MDPRTLSKGFFYRINNIIHRPIVSEVDPNVFYTTQLYLDQETQIYEKRVYNIFELLDELGGMIEIMYVVGFIFLYPYNKYFFV